MGLIGYGAAWDLGRAIAGATRRATRDRYATVTRRDPDGVTWGTIAGASGEVPLGGSLADAEVGDVVAVDWRGGVPVASGNATSPSVGARQVEGAVAPVRAASVAAQGAARAARSVADAAQKVAEAVNQHFFADTSGIHVTAATQDEWDADHSGPNVLINSLGQLFRDGLNNLLTLTTEDGARALTIWDGLGNAASNVRAVIGEVITLGKANESHAEIDYNSLQFIDGSGNTFFLVNDAAEVSEATSLVEVFESTGLSSDRTLTLNYSPVRSPSIYRSDGRPSTITSISGNVLTLENALYPNSIAIVQYETSDYLATNGKTMVLGVNENVPLATGAYSASVGTENQPSGNKSMTVGSGCRTVDPNTLASGSDCLAGGEESVALGMSAKAVGIASFAQGGNVIAYGPYQHAIGRFNEIDTDGKYPLVIGNGTANGARYNAMTVDWNGSVVTRSASHAGTERPTSNTPLQKIDSYDSEGESVGYAQIVLTSGGVYRSYAVRNPTTGEAVALYLRALDNGTKQLALSSGATIADSAIPTLDASKIGSGTLSADRIPTLAIGTKTSGTLARDRGGTGVTAKQASTVTLNNSAASTNHCWHNGILATVTLGALHLSSALADGSSRNVGTVPSGYRPSDSVWIVGGTNANASTGKVFIAIASSGAITLYNRSGASLGTGVNMYFTATYAI